MNKKNYIWLGILVILVIVFFLSRQREFVERRMDLFNFNSDDITRVEFIQPVDTLIIVRTEGGWMIEHPRVVPVRETQLTRFFTEYLELTASRTPISESVDRQERFQVDEASGIQIAVFGRNNRLLSRKFLGRGQNPNVAYIRAANDNKIYQISNVFSAVNPSMHAWRENRIVTFAENEINSIAIARGGTTYTLTQEFGMWNVVFADEEHNITLGNADFRRFMNTLTGLSTNVFFDDEYESFEARFVNPALGFLVTLNTGEEVILSIAQLDDNAYILKRNDETNTLYRLTAGLFNQLAVEADRFIE